MSAAELIAYYTKTAKPGAETPDAVFESRLGAALSNLAAADYLSETYDASKRAFVYAGVGACTLALSGAVTWR